MNSFSFALGLKAKIIASGESGQIIARAQYLDGSPNRYLLRYKAADGRAVEDWWSEDAIEADE